MAATFQIVLPLFLLMAIGYGAIRSGAVAAETDKGLADFVFVLAIPVLIFRSIVSAPALEAEPWTYLTVAFGGIFAIWMLAAVTTRALGATGAEATVYGFAAAQANGVFLGMPLVLRSYGSEANAPLVMFISLHVPVMMIVGAVLLERSGHKFDRLGLALALARHPLMIASAAGIVWRALGWPIPALLAPVTDGLAAAAVPAALVSLGMALARYGALSRPRITALIVLAKLLLQPLLVLVLARSVFALPPVWAGTAVLLAACPSGINAYLFGVRYGAGEAATASAVTLSTAFSVVTISIWLWVLGVGMMP
jgi:hypothetical protein